MVIVPVEYLCVRHVHEVVMLLVVSVDKEKLKFATTTKAEIKKTHHTIPAINEWHGMRETNFSAYQNW